MHWTYLFIASCFEVCWLYSLKFIDIKKIRAIPWSEFFSTSEHVMKVLPVLGYAVFGICNIIFFSQALRKIPASTAFAIWVGVAMVVAKVIDILIFKEPYSMSQILFTLLVLVGIIGLRISGQA